MLEENLDENLTGVAERSPSPKRSKFRGAGSPERGSSAELSSRSNGSSGSSGAGVKQLPEVAPEARNIKRALWRQRRKLLIDFF